MIPQPVWGSVYGTSLGSNNTNQRFDPQDQLALELQEAAEEGSIAPLLPDGVGEQMMSMGLLDESGTPQGMLFDQGALELAAASVNQPQSLANPISISRVQSAYVPIDSDNGRVDITFSVTNNQTPESLPLIPENATVTETLDILSTFDYSADPATVRNVIIADSLTANAQLAETLPAAEQSASELIWNLGDIPPLGTVTATLAVTIPTTVADFIALDSGATAFGSLKGREVRASAAPGLMGPDSFAPYLRSTVDADISDEYMLKALGEVGSDPLALFAFVQGMGFESYQGSLRGTRGTLWSEAGNSVDQSSLLIALLRASGTPARYAHGTLAQPETQQLILSMFPEPVSVFGTIPAGTPLADPANDLDLLTETSDHWWVQAYIGGSWVDLDPSFSGATPGQTFTAAVEDLAELPDTLRHKVKLSVRVEQYSFFSLLLGYLDPDIIRPLETTLNAVELVGKPVTFNQLVASSGSGFILSIVEHKYTPNFIIGEYEAVITGDTYQDVFANFAGGLGNRFSTALWVEVTTTTPAGETEEYEREIIDLIGPEARQGGTIPNIAQARSDAQQPYVSPTDMFQLQVVSQSKQPQEVGSRSIMGTIIETGSLEESYLAYQNSPDGSTQQNIAFKDFLEKSLLIQYGQLKNLGDTFLDNNERYSSDFAAISLVKAYPKKPRLLLLSQTTTDNENMRTTFELLNFRQEVLAAPGQAEEAAYSANLVLSMNAKAIENVVLSDFGDERRSALPIIQEAREIGIEVALIGEENVAILARLNISEEARARIKESVVAGNNILVPTQMVPINGELAIGWLEIDETGYISSVLENGTRASELITYAIGALSAIFRARLAAGFAAGFFGTIIAFIAGFLKYVAKNCLSDSTECNLGDAFVEGLKAASLVWISACSKSPALGTWGCLGATVAIGLILKWASSLNGNDPPVPPVLVGGGTDLDASSVATRTLAYPATLSGNEVSGSVVNLWTLLDGASGLPIEASLYADASGGLGLGFSADGGVISSSVSPTLSAGLTESVILLGPSSSTIEVVGAGPVPAANLALIDFAGNLQAFELPTGENQIDLNGAGQFFALNTDPVNSTITAAQTAAFDLNLTANFADGYTITAEAPQNWVIEISDTGLVTVEPALDAAAGDYSVLVTAQSGQAPAAFSAAVHTVTLLENNSVTLDIARETPVTVPMGLIQEANAYPGENGHIDNGQAQIPDAAYVITLANASTNPHTYQIDVSGLPAGWTLLSGANGAANKTVDLAAGQTAEIGLYVNPPDGTVPAAGTSYNIQVSAVGVDDPTLTAADAIVFTMPTVPFPYLTTDQDDYFAEPDSTVEVDLGVNNVGNTAGSFPVTTTVYGDIYAGEAYTSAVLPVTPAVFDTAAVAAGEATTTTLTVDTTGAQLGEVYVVESHSAAGAYEPISYATIKIVSAAALQAKKAAEKLKDLDDDIAGTYAEEVAEVIDKFVDDLTDPDAKQELIDTLEAFVDSLEEGPGRQALEAVIEDLIAHTDPAELIEDVNDLIDALDILGEELDLRAAYPYTIDLTPGSSGNLPGQVTTYTLSINNLGANVTTYQVDFSTPAGPNGTTAVVNPGASADIDIPVSSTTLSYYTITAQTVVLESGVPLTATTRSRSAAFNVVDRYLDVLAVNADPNFVEAGSGSSQISVAVANVINAYQPVIAATTVISPDGTTVYSSTLPLNIVTGVPQIYQLNTVDTSAWGQGIYTITVDLLDGSDQLIPNGTGFGFLGVGQSLEAEHSVFPEIVPPGNITVTTTITTEVKAGGSGSAVAPSVNIVQADEPATKAGRVINGLARVVSTDELLAVHDELQLATNAPITPTGFLRTEAYDPDLVYSSGWSNSTFNLSSNNDTRRSQTAGTVMTATVNAEWVALGLMTCPGCGEAEIIIDGVSQGTIDTYSRYNDTLSLPYNLGTGLHTVEVVVQGTRSAFASDEWVYVDYIDSWDGSVLPTGFFEQDNGRVLRSTNWGNLNSGAASSGTYFRDGSNVWFPFTGDSVTFQALAYSGAGQVHLRLDGQSLGFVDLYSLTTVTRTFSLDNLGPGIHVLQVQAHRGRATVDGFNAPAVEPSNVGLPRTGIVRHEEDDSALRYNGVPFQQSSQSWNYGTAAWGSRGYVAFSRTGGDTVSLTFDGTWVNLGFVTRTNAGIAEIFIDGVSQGTIDTYSRYDLTRSIVFDNLTAGTHTVEVVALDQRNPNATDDYIHLDFIDVWDGTPMADGTFEGVVENYDANTRLNRSSNWGNLNSGAASGGTYLRDGSSVWFPFTGESISYQYLAYSGAGQVEILIDGQNQGLFDLYNPSTIIRTVSFDGLGSGAHVMQIRAFRGRATVDTFTTPGTAPFYTEPASSGIVRYEESAPEITYNGAPYAQTSTTWSYGSASWGSRGFVAVTRTGGDTVSLTFDGTWVNLGFVTRSNAGIAEIFIDGVSQGTVDTYSRYDTTSSIVFDGLVPGAHTIEIVALDQRNPNATDDYIHLDFIDVWGGGAVPDGTFEAVLEPYDGDERVLRSTNWSNANSGTASSGTYLRSGSSAWFPFTGETVSYQYLAYSGAGQVEVLIDGQNQGIFDLYNPSTVTRTLSFDGLGSGPHMLQVRAYRGTAVLDTFSSPGGAPFYVEPVPTGIVRHEESDLLFNGAPYLQTSTSWSFGNLVWGSGGYSGNSRTGGDTMSFTFDGTWINLGLLTRSNSGLAEIFIDGVSQGVVDTYSRYDTTRSLIYDNLAPGTHTLEVVVLDQRGPNATDDWVHIDYVDVWDGTAMPDGTFDSILQPIDGDERPHRSSNWGSSNSASALNGSYLRDGSNVWFPFTGDSVTYQPLTFNSAGQVEILIDGQSQGIFDLYSPVTQQRAISFDGLGAGPHVMQIQAFRNRAVADGFTTPGTPPFVEPPSAAAGIIRHEEDDLALRYNGLPYKQTATTWTYGTYAWSSRGFGVYSRTAGDTVSLTFDGTWVNLGFVTRNASGQAEIFIDGVSQGIVDTYGRYDSTINRVFDGLTPGTHTVEVVVLGQRNPNSTDNWVRLDYIDVWDGTAMPDGTFETVLEPNGSDQRIWRSTNWGNANNAAASSGSYLQDGSSVWFPFTGDSVSYQMLAFSSAGVVEVVIDGQTVDFFDLYNPVTEPRTFSFDGLGAGPHVLQIKAYRNRAVLDTFASPGTAPFYVPPAPTGIIRHEENDPAIRYNGLPYFETGTSWSYGSYAWSSRGFGVFSRTAGDTLSFDFNGTWVGLGFVGRTSAGQAEIFIDGISQGIVDTYTAGDRTVSVYYDGLADTTHTIEVVVLGQRNPNSSDNWVRLDYIDVWDGTAMPDGTVEAVLEPYDGDERLWRSPNWARINSPVASLGSYLRDGSSVWFPFTGTSVNYDGILYSGAGTVEVFIDGVSQGLVTLTDPAAFARPFSYINLPDGPHVMQIRAAGGRATVDGFTTPGTLVKFEPSNADLAASIGAPNTFPIEVTNYGGVTDTFAINTTSTSWPVSLNPENVTLTPGQSVVVSATVVVPPTALLGDTNVVTINATSTGQGGFESVTTLNLYAVDVRSQLCLAIDASGSVSGVDFNLAKAGLAAALRDPDTVPRDGTVEISVIQFPLGSGIVELEPTVIVSAASAEAAAQRIEAIVKSGGGTPMEDGIRVCKDLIVNSPHFVSAENHIINLATDGAPNNAGATLTQRTLALDAGINQINAEAIGGANISFLRDQLVYPQPGYLAPPFDDSGNGFVIPISTFEEFADSIRQKLQFVLGIYNLDVTHTIPVTGTTVLTDTISPAADAVTLGPDSDLINWTYTLAGDGDQQVLTLETQLPDMQPGETRVVASGTTVSYTVPGGDSAVITLPPLLVAAPHLIALDPPLQTVGTGATAFYTATLLNLTGDPLDLRLDVVGFPAGWVSGDGGYTVPANSELPVIIAVAVPDEADLGSYSFTAVVNTTTGGQDQAGAQLDVVDGFNITVTPPVQTILVGDVATYTISVENPTPFAETYALSLNGLDAAAAAALLPSIVVDGNGSGTVELPVVGAFPEGVQPFTVQAIDSSGVIDTDDALLRIEGATGVDLALDPLEQVTGPGAPAPFVVTVTNLGDFIDTFDFDVTLPAGWAYEWLANGQTADPITLTPAVFNAADLGLLITPPAGTVPGGYPFAVTAVSDINASAQAAVTGTVTVAGPGVVVDITPDSTTVDPLVPAVWNVTVTNTGTAADTFDLSTLGLAGAVGQFSAGSVALGAGESTVVQLTIDPPDFLISGTTYPLEVTAVAQSDSRISNFDVADVQVSGFPGVDLAWQPLSQEVNAGGSVDYLLTVTNTGNIPLTYDLTLTASGPAGDVTLTPEADTIDLPAGFAGVIRVTADSAVTAEGSYTLNGTASSGTVSASDTAALLVNLVNSPPVAVDDAAATDEDVAVEIDVLANDSDPDGDPLTISGITAPASGEIVVTAANTLAYTPTLHFNGVVTVSYTVDDGQGLSDTAQVVITVNPVNDDPAAVDDTAETLEDIPAVIDVLANDGDVDGDSLTVTGLSSPADGAVAINPDQTVVYTPTLDFNGVVSFTYTIEDGAGGSAAAVVTVTVLPVNDAPTAVDDEAATPEDTPLEIDVLANDSDVDGDALTIAGVTQPAEGLVQLTAGQTLLYTPTLNFNGLVTMTYTINDGFGLTDTARVTVTVVPVNDGPIAVDDVAATAEDTSLQINVLDNDGDVDGDPLAVIAVGNPLSGSVVINPDSSVSYTPTLNFNGSDVFTYTISDDSGLTDSAVVTVTVTPVEDGPLAVDDLVTTDEDTAVTVDALANDLDDDGDVLSIVALTQPTNGAAVLNADGTVTITPTLNFNGELRLDYTISDGTAQDVGEIVVTVLPINDPPVAVDDAETTVQNQAVIVDVLANDNDVDGDPLTVMGVTQGSGGTANILSDGRIEFVPNPGFLGITTFTYTVVDGRGGSDTAVVTITVNLDGFGDRVYVSLSGNGQIDGMAVKDEDIIVYDPAAGSWSMYFDGSDLGMDTKAGYDIDAFTILDDGSILFSIVSAAPFPGIGYVADFDIVRFIPTSLGEDTAGSFELYFFGDGAEMYKHSDDIDALELLPDGRILVSTRGGGEFDFGKFRDEDILVFTPTQLGPQTQGTWDLYFDGSDVGFGESGREDINALRLLEGDIYTSVRGEFDVSGLTGDGADVIYCISPTPGIESACAGVAPYLDGSENGLTGEVIDGLHIKRE
ncbi:MAG: tandem-95 repeat protein [Ardenticatenaceae bacterium]|nr:tandem-95 repeat protein [Ardenticatenaceae bacterium]